MGMRRRGIAKASSVKHLPGAGYGRERHIALKKPRDLPLKVTDYLLGSAQSRAAAAWTLLDAECDAMGRFSGSIAGNQRAGH